MEYLYPSAGHGRAEQRRHGRRHSVNGRETNPEKGKRTRTRERKFETAGGTMAEGRGSHRQQSKQKRKLFLFFFLLLLLGGLAGGLVVLWPLLFGDECSNIDLPPEYRAIICARLKAGVTCEFNVIDCEVDCPLGLQTDDYMCITSCDCATEGLFESDVAFDKDTMQQLLSAYMTVEDHTFTLFSGSATKMLNIWNLKKTGTRIRIPYVLYDDLDPAVVTGIKSAINQLREKTCIDMTVLTDQADYVSFVDGVGCSSSVSRIGGQQYITLSSDCNSIGTILHEIMHTLGFWHEHSRPDRDENIMIMWENIDKSDQHNFNKRSIDTVFDFGSPYDKLSLMHGSGFSNSLDKEAASMIDLETGSAVKIQRDELTVEDIKEINSLYECYVEKVEAPLPGANWGPWSDVGLCSATCGEGMEYRIRECLNDKEELVLREYCGEDYYGEQECNSGIKCEQGKWGPWSPCDMTCGHGTRTRMSCCGTNSTKITESCKVQDCTDPEPAFWTEWQSWGECLRTCGNGMRRRYRTCFDMFETAVESLRCPQVGKAHLDIEICATEPCPKGIVNRVGNWGEWGPWDECTRSCGGGSHKRERTCFDEEGGIENYCIGSYNEVKACNSDITCPDSPLSIWTPWSPWSECSVTCGGGVRTKKRTCQSSGPLTIETDCSEGSQELMEVDSRLETCNNEDCDPSEAQWSDWSSWGECSGTCMGNQWRLRTCIGGELGDPACPWDGIYEGRVCNGESCSGGTGRMLEGEAQTGSRWARWYQWTECSLSCDGGTRKRYRLCQTEEMVLSYDCSTADNDVNGYMTEIQECNTKPCRLPDAEWSEWDPWDTCTVTCGRGLMKRRRTCLSKHRCSGPRLGAKSCIEPDCEDTKTESPTEKTEEMKGIFASEKLASFFGKRTKTPKTSTTTTTKTNWPTTTDKPTTTTDRSTTTTTDKPTITTTTDRPTTTTTDKPTTTAKAQSGMFEARPWSRESSFCDQHSRLYLGDFNADGSKDMLCLSTMGKMKISYATRDGTYGSIGWEMDVGFCAGINVGVYALDFNGDGADDLMCYQRLTGEFKVLFAYRGKFDGKGRELLGKTPPNFCKSPMDILFVTDVNFDGKGDLVCRRENSAEQIVINRYKE